MEFRLPDLGEGLTEADLVSWSVAVGDVVELNQVIAEVETAKALVELPSPYAGTVSELLVPAGETVAVGAPIIRISTGTEAPERRSVLVGYGPGAEQASRRRRGASVSVTGTGGARPDAKPSARKLARELGVDLTEVPTANGIATVDDVQAHVSAVSGARPPSHRETRTKVTGVRKWTAEAMTKSWREVPHVTEFVDVDVTASMELIEHLRGTPSFEDLKLTPLALVAKTVLSALGEQPSLNSAWAGDDIVTRPDVNLGIAAATPRGLMVPNIKDAHRLSLRDLCREIARLTDTARAGTATPAELTGGTFTITNIGVFGIDTGTPIINPGEAAILCLGAIRKRPWVFQDEIAVRWVTTLGLSFDHRLVDGEQGSKFLAEVAALLADPLALLGRS